MLQPGTGAGRGEGLKVSVLRGFPSPQLVTAQTITHMDSICMTSVTLNSLVSVVAGFKLHWNKGFDALALALTAQLPEIHQKDPFLDLMKNTDKLTITSDSILYVEFNM